MTALTIQGYAYTTDDIDDDPVFVNTTLVNGVWDLGNGFTAATLPAVGSQIAPDTDISIDSTFDPVNGIGRSRSVLSIYKTLSSRSTYDSESFIVSDRSGFPSAPPEGPSIENY